MTHARRLADWAVRVVEAEYPDDVCLLLGRWTRHFGEEPEELGFHYYIPATSRSNGLTRTFIIDGIGYDLFPMSWERVERIADLRGDNPVCLEHAVILYARNDDDRRAFTSLQARLLANLDNPRVMQVRAVEALDAAMQIHRDMLFDDDARTVREYAGYLCMRVADAVAYLNHRYLALPDHVQALRSLTHTPAGFIELHERIIRAKTVEEQRRRCHDIIMMTRRFLAEHEANSATRPGTPDFSELACWYQELSYTWRRIYGWCDRQDTVNAYLWGCFLQRELDTVSTDFALAGLDILGAFDADNLPAFRSRAEQVEQKIVAAIGEHGAAIESYPSIEAFIQQND